MPPRREVESGLRPQPFRPSSAPVDTFVSPASSPLRDVARALGEGSDTLRRFGAGLADREKEQDAGRAQADVQRLAASNKSYTDAIREGLISPGESPWYRFAAREAFGRLEATRFTSTLLGDVDQILTESDGNVDFDAAVAQRLQEQGAAGRDEAYRSGFFRNLDNQLANARSRFEARRTEVVEARSAETMSATMYEGLRQALTVNGDLLDPANRASLVAPLRGEGSRMMVVNPRAGSAVNQAMISAVVSLAEEQGDPAILGLLDEIVLPGGGRLSATVAARDAKGRALGEISQRNGYLDRARQRQIESRTDAIYGEINTAVAQGETPNWAAYRAELSSFGGDGLRSLNALKDQYAMSQNFSDAIVNQNLTRDILLNNGEVTYQSIARQVGNGLSPQDAGRLTTLLRSTQRFFTELPAPIRQGLSEGRTRARNIARERVGGIFAFGSTTAELATKQRELETSFVSDFTDHFGNPSHRGETGIEVTRWVNDWVDQQRRSTELPKPDAANPPSPGSTPVSPEEAQQLLNEVDRDLADDGDIQESLRVKLTRARVPRQVRDRAEIEFYLTTPRPNR